VALLQGGFSTAALPTAKERSNSPEKKRTMTELAPNKNRRLILVGILVCASVLFALVFGNIFPDQTWTALNAARTLYSEMVSRMIPVPTSASRSIEEDRIREAVLRYLIESTVRLHVFLKIDGKDPSDRFMAQFADLNRAVEKGSEVTHDCCGMLWEELSGRSEVFDFMASPTGFEPVLPP
jgi:hypothetical protein